MLPFLSGLVKRPRVIWRRIVLDEWIEMTYYGLMKTMSISAFKAGISEALKRVRRGERIVIVNRDIPVAEVVPYNKKNDTFIRAPQGKLKFERPSFTVEIDPLVFLMEDRDKR
jgi:prevent-host-death family protein